MFCKQHKMTTIDLCSDTEEQNLQPSPIIEKQYINKLLNDEYIKETSSVVNLNKFDSYASSSGVFCMESKNIKDTPYGYDEDDDCPLSIYNKKKTISPPVSKAKKSPRAKKDKSLIEREKALKLAIKSNSKSLKPGECIKYITVEIGSGLLSKPYCSKVLSTLNESNIKYKTEPPIIADEKCIGWKRNSLKHFVNDEAKLSTTQSEVQEPFILVVLDMSEMEELLIDRSLNTRMQFYKESTNYQVTLLLYGSKAYFRGLNGKKPKAKKAKNVSSKVCQNDLDYYLTKLLFELSVSCVKCESHEELAQIIYQYTKSISEIPFKKERNAVDDMATFYMRGDNKGCVQVDKNGKGLLQLWCKALTKFPTASLETAQAIVNNYPSPVLFIQYLQSDSAENVIKTISDIPVRRSAGPLASTRRVGAQLAQKLYVFFTATDGQQPIS